MDAVIVLKEIASSASWSCDLTGMRWLKSPRSMCLVASYSCATAAVTVRVMRAPMMRAISSMMREENRHAQQDVLHALNELAQRREQMGI